MDVVISLPTLERLLSAEQSWPDQLLTTLPLELQSQVSIYIDDEASYFYGLEDEHESRLIHVYEIEDPTHLQVSDLAQRVLWERISTLAILTSRPRLQVPRTWGQYRYRNRIAFAAVPRRFGIFRWIAEFRVEGTQDLVLWRLYGEDRDLDLARFNPEIEKWSSRRAGWLKRRNTILTALAQRGNGSSQPLGVTSSINLAEATFGAVTGGRTYSDWLPRLTPRQKEFVDTPSSPSVKVRGPAGSGKTLTLQLKLLREVYRAREADRNIRVLFATHSWAMAEQVDESLTLLDESGGLSEVDVMPLLSIVEAIAGTEYQRFEILGDDNESGKRLQLEEIGKLVQEVKEGDWITLQTRASAFINGAMDAEAGSSLRNTLCWDLMQEFGTVLAANGILPGITAAERYREIHRAPWMMPIRTDADRTFVLSIYTRLVDTLRALEMMTSDQLIADLLLYLATFAWNIRRAEVGYDFIFVDELHMFTEQERMVLQFLSIKPSEYPILFMALDPRQSPAEVYVNVDSDKLTRDTRQLPVGSLAGIRSVELTTVHRFTPQILQLVKHINDSFPAFELGDEWQLDLSNVDTTRAPGAIPEVVISSTRGAHLKAIESALKASSHERTAIVLTDNRVLYDYVGYISVPPNQRLVVIDGRDAVENLRYAKRAVVLGAADYLGGLQFDNVLVVMANSGRSGDNRAILGRKEISMMYLAVTRATAEVTLFVDAANSGVPPVIESAIKAGAVRKT